MNFLFSFITETCKKLGIDESHGLNHSKGTLRYAEYLIKHIPDITEEERHMAIFASAIHDLCDSKYTNIELASNIIREWLNELHWTPSLSNSLISILQTMSYSKLKSQRGTLETPLFPDHGKWQRSYEIARNADLLESFVVARCVLYNKHIFPEKTEDEHWNRAKELFEERVFKYKSDGWITLPSALALIPRLEAEARRCLEQRCMAWPFDKEVVM